MENLALQENEVINTRFDFYQTTTLLRSLVEVLSIEVEMLAQMKIQDMKPMQAKKNQLAADLEKQLAAYKANGAAKASMTAARASELKDLLAEYESVTALYQDELFKAQQVNETTIGMIVDLVREHAQRSNGYGKGGTRSGVAEFNNTGYCSATPAMKFNEQI